MAKTKDKGQVVPQASRTLTPYEEMDRFFDRMWEGGMLRPFDMHWPLWGGMRMFREQMPKVDVIEREKDVLVKAELPGMKKEEVEVALDDDFLTIKAEHVEEKKEEGEYLHSEMHRGSFIRTLRLPSPVDGEKVEANFKDGILEITLPKTEAVSRRKVEIR